MRVHVWLVSGIVGLCAAQGAVGQRADAEARQQRRTPVVEVFETTRDAVVNISATQVIQVRSAHPFDQLFEGLFDMPRPPEMRRPREVRRTSVGSGFVLHADGYVVTNAHVVQRTAERKVIFGDGREYDARVVAADPQRDLAVLKIDADGPLPTITLGHSHDLMIGETVVAIGNPLGYQHTVTAGVVSATDRELPVSDEIVFRGLIQTDASINPGNSGGPLLNVLGELIGVNTAIRADAQNIGFAIPVDQLRQVLPEMLNVERRYGIVTGIVFKPFDADNRGASLVERVEPGSPAEAAGIRPDDWIVSVDGKLASDTFAFHIALLGRKPGDTIRMSVHQMSEPRPRGRQIELTLAARPKPDGAQLLARRMGLAAQPLKPEMARAMGIVGAKGLLIDRVEPGGPSQQAGVERGDVLLQIGRHEAATLDEVGQLLDQIAPHTPLTIDVLRLQGRTLYRLRLRVVAQ
jgi:serine protease Do